MYSDFRSGIVRLSNNALNQRNLSTHDEDVSQDVLVLSGLGEMFERFIGRRLALSSVALRELKTFPVAVGRVVLKRSEPDRLYCHRPEHVKECLFCVFQEHIFTVVYEDSVSCGHYSRDVLEAQIRGCCFRGPKQAEALIDGGGYATGHLPVGTK